MDAHTLELLEFPKIREMVAGYAASSLGKELARQIETSRDLPAICGEIQLVTEMSEVLSGGQSPPFGGLHDVRLFVRRAAIGAMLTTDQLLQVAETLTCTGNIFRFRMRLPDRFQGLIQLLSKVDDLGLVAKSISGCMDSRGHVLDMADPELAQIRKKIHDLDERIQNRLKRLLRDPEVRRILRFPNATISGDHHVLPVSINFRHKLAGVVHRTSSTGETVYIEPEEIAGLSAERVLLKNEEDREIRKILRRLSAEVGKISYPLARAVESMARLDLITAKARFSLDYQMAPPVISVDGPLWLRQARHPILEFLFRKKSTSTGELVGSTIPTPFPQVVPIDIRLGQPFRILIITGPNTGGKTVSLKTAGLLCMMALSGMHIPAGQGSSVPLFHDILADIGDEQSLEQSLSTFSSHMSRIALILEQADRRSLVFLDELGAGTDPAEGAALGRAILDELDRKQCLAMVTTHLGDLKTYAFHNEKAENAAVEFDVETLRPTYRLLIGQYGMSNALQIAKRLKLPKPLLHRARKYLRRKQRRTPELAQLQEKKAEAEKARIQALEAQLQAQVQKEEYEKKMAELQRDSEQAAALREARLRLKPNDPVRVPRFDKPGQIVRLDFKKNMAVVSVGLGQWEIPLDDVFPIPP